MPTPSMAAAIITPARLDLDSRTSSVYIALPAPSDISWARSSSPASRQAAAGSRRKRARNAGSASRRSISLAATSASVAATPSPLRGRRRLDAAHPLQQRLAHNHDHGQEERHPERAHDHVDHPLRRIRDSTDGLLIAQRHADREQRGQGGPAEPPERVLAEH